MLLSLSIATGSVKASGTSALKDSFKLLAKDCLNSIRLRRTVC